MGSSLLDCPAAQTRYTVSTLVAAAAAAVRCYSFSHATEEAERGASRQGFGPPACTKEPDMDSMKSIAIEAAASNGFSLATAHLFSGIH